MEWDKDEGFSHLSGGSYLLTLSKPMENFPTDNPDADTLRIVAELETAVRASPEQYLWVHRRFKAREGLSDVYAD